MREVAPVRVPWLTFNAAGGGLMDAVDESKRITFDLSGVATATTRAITFLNAAGINALASAIPTLGSVIFAGASGVYNQDNANFFWDATNHRLGLGTTGPNEQLEITKNFRLPVTTGATVGVIFSGADRFLHTFGTNNIYFGARSGNYTQSGSGSNLGVGSDTLAAISTGAYNTALGHGALQALTTGSTNIAIGYNSMSAASGGAAQNIAIGTNALTYITTGTNNIALGPNAGIGTNWVSTGTYCIFIGDATGFASSTQRVGAVAIGRGALVDQDYSVVFGGVSYNYRVGIGVTAPAAGLHIVRTTEQLRLGYDASNYVSSVVDSAGIISHTPIGTSGTGAGFVFNLSYVAGGVYGDSFSVNAFGSPMLQAFCSSYTLDGGETWLQEARLGFFGATPVKQPIGDAKIALSDLGLIAVPTWPFTGLTGTATTAQIAANAVTLPKMSLELTARENLAILV